MAVIIGSFIPIFLLTSLIIVHELGHFLMAILFKIEVDKIYIYPFGGISKFNISFNESLIKEFIILIMGPLFQMIFYLIIININYFDNYISLITVYNYTILFFNLLPIYPLDGGKLLNIILSSKIAFKKSLNISIYFSYFVIICLSYLLLCRDISINIIVIISFLFFKIGDERKKKKYIFDKFLLERYLNNYEFKKRKEVNKIDDFMRERYHIIKIKDKYYTEKAILNKKFNK